MCPMLKEQNKHMLVDGVHVPSSVTTAVDSEHLSVSSVMPGFPDSNDAQAEVMLKLGTNVCQHAVIWNCVS